jgi:hypothetical protein
MTFLILPDTDRCSLRTARFSAPAPSNRTADTALPECWTVRNGIPALQAVKYPPRGRGPKTASGERVKVILPLDSSGEESE